MILRAVLPLFFFLLFSFSAQADETPGGFKEYKVCSGDCLGKIAPREHWDLIQRVNRIDERHLIAGKKILVPHNIELAKLWVPVPEKVAEPKAEREVRIFLNSQFFGAYENGKLVHWGPISSGKSGYQTPTGKFQVIWKTSEYYSKKYDAKMPFAINFSDGGHFLHAQSLPGRPASHGCIRLLEADAEKLYYWVKKGDSIIIM